MISSAVTVRHLYRSRAISEADNLVAQADPEDWYVLRRNLPYDSGCVLHCRRIARAVRQEHSVWFQLERGLGRSLRRPNCHATIVIAEKTEDVPLDAVVVS